MGKLIYTQNIRIKNLVWMDKVKIGSIMLATRLIVVE